MDYPKVSVIVPIFNREKFIKETIDSVVDQTFTNWELLLVDDGSTDGSQEIAINYANQYPNKIHYFCHEGHQNRGANPSRNLGFNNSRGDIILFLDSDDVLLPQKFENHVALLEAHPEADTLCGETYYWHSWTNKPEDNSRDYVYAPWKHHDIQPYTLVEPPGLLRHLISQSLVPNPSGFLLRRDIVDRVGGWDDDYKYSFQDQAFYVKIFLRATVIFAPGYFEKYRLHEDSMGSVVAKTGRYLHDYLFFLSWAEKYLSNQDYHDTIIEELIRNELKPYRHPINPDQVELPLPVGLKNFGDLHRLSPVSRNWGFDRGPLGPGQRAQNVDRYYIEAFLQHHSGDIKGRVLEIGDSLYTHEFGGDRVTLPEVLDADPNNKAASYIFDLALCDEAFPQELFDCFILIQTLLFTYDLQMAIKNAYIALKPGGILLATLPGISQICRPEMEQWGDYWRFTDASARRLFGDVFGIENITVETHGNVLAASAFLFNLGSHELKKEELDFNDPDYQVTITVRAIKKEHKSFPTPNMVKVLTTQFSMREQEVAVCEQELAEIKRSKAWQLALLLRRFRIILVPPGGSRALVLRKSLKILLFPLSKYKRGHALKNNVALVKASGFFDETWYLTNNPDVAQAKVDPCKHYLLYGGFEGRDPGPDFSNRRYLEANPDVKKASVNPLLHYIMFGKNEGRSTK